MPRFDEYVNMAIEKSVRKMHISINPEQSQLEGEKWLKFESPSQFLVGFSQPSEKRFGVQQSNFLDKLNDCAEANTLKAESSEIKPPLLCLEQIFNRGGDDHCIIKHASVQTVTLETKD
jgi:hypothetical protein